MKVLDLRCANDHGFEGWFASGDAFESQRATGRIECPVCGSADIAKLPAAPRLNLSGAKEPRPAQDLALPAVPPDGRASAPDPDNAFAALWMNAVRQIVARTEDVGDRFVDEARKMHYGETDERAIRGRATPAQATALVEEGIDVVSLPLPAAFKQTLQ